MNDFLDKVSDIVETPVTETTRFEDIPNWSSLMLFGLLVLAEQDYGHALTVTDFIRFATVGDFARACLTSDV